MALTVGIAGAAAGDRAGAQPAGAEARAFTPHRVMRVDARRAAAAAHADAVRSAASRRRCVAVEHMAGAMVVDDRAVELTMASGIRWRLNFARDCPALSFYQGFYYRREQAGALCAARDAVIARSGGECAIESIIALRPVGRRRGVAK